MNFFFFRFTYLKFNFLLFNSDWSRTNYQEHVHIFKNLFILKFKIIESFYIMILKNAWWYALQVNDVIMNYFPLSMKPIYWKKNPIRFQIWKCFYHFNKMFLNSIPIYYDRLEKRHSMLPLITNTRKLLSVFVGQPPYR